MQTTEQLKRYLINLGYNENDVEHQINRTKELDRDVLLLQVHESRKRNNVPLDQVPLIVMYHSSLPPLKVFLLNILQYLMSQRD